MPIETLDDVVEWCADQANVYGAHDDEDDEACEKHPCRCCWTDGLRTRLEAAFVIEKKLRGD